MFKKYLGYLPESMLNYRKKLYACFDIETIEDRYDIDNDNEDSTKKMAELNALSIAVGTNIEGAKSEYFVRKSSNPHDGQEMIEKFMQYLLDLQCRYKDTVPLEFSSALDAVIFEQKIAFSENNKFLISRLTQFREHLSSYLKLTVFGYNSSKFDLPVLIGGIVKFANERNLNVKPLKVGCRYMSLVVGSIVFRDVLNYTSPCSLDKFLKQWGATLHKSIFPHR